MTNIEMGLRIQELRKDLILTREDLAEKAEISTKFLYEIEMGKKGVSAETLLKIAQALSTSCDYLLTGEGVVKEESRQERNMLNGFSQKQVKRLEKIIKLIYELCNDK